MGASNSKPKGCLSFVKKTKKTSKLGRTRRVCLHPVDDVESRHSSNYTRRAMQGTGNKSTESSWFDCASLLESEVNEVFGSPRADLFSRHSSEISLSFSSSGDSSKRSNVCISCTHPWDEGKKSKELPHHDPECNVVGEIDKDANNPNVQSNTCLSCIPLTIPTVERKRSLSPVTPRSRRKVSPRCSVESREGRFNPTFVSSEVHLQRPVAGSSVPYCPVEKRMPDCWSHIKPSSFKVRGGNYVRDKKKEFAPNYAAYYPFGVDVFLSQQKINHIARFVQLPALNLSEEVPSILVVNIQMPSYPVSLFQSENDGEGINLVLYFKLSESYSMELPSHFQENIIRIINDGMEGGKSFFVGNITPFRERLKILGRVANLNDLPLSKTEKKLVNAYNEKPVLSRPQHEFYLGENYFEIDLDLHRFSFVARKGFETLRDIFKLCILDFGLTIQGDKAEDLPEHMLCCIRLNEIDYRNHQQLGF